MDVGKRILRCDFGLLLLRLVLFLRVRGGCGLWRIISGRRKWIGFPMPLTDTAEIDAAADAHAAAAAIMPMMTMMVVMFAALSAAAAAMARSALARTAWTARRFDGFLSGEKEQTCADREDHPAFCSASADCRDWGVHSFFLLGQCG
jgi:hypothetical protein